MCLSQIINLKRGTKDIDFLLKEMDAGEKNLEDVFNDICSVKHNDGFKFSNPEIQQLSLEPVNPFIVDNLLNSLRPLIQLNLV